MSSDSTPESSLEPMSPPVTPCVVVDLTGDDSDADDARVRTTHAVSTARKSAVRDPGSPSFVVAPGGATTKHITTRTGAAARDGQDRVRTSKQQQRRHRIIKSRALQQPQRQPQPGCGGGVGGGGGIMSPPQPPPQQHFESRFRAQIVPLAPRPPQQQQQVPPSPPRQHAPPPPPPPPGASQAQLVALPSPDALDVYPGGYNYVFSLRSAPNPTEPQRNMSAPVPPPPPPPPPYHQDNITNIPSKSDLLAYHYPQWPHVHRFDPEFSVQLPSLINDSLRVPLPDNIRVAMIRAGIMPVANHQHQHQHQPPQPHPPVNHNMPGHPGPVHVGERPGGEQRLPGEDEDEAADCWLGLTGRIRFVLDQHARDRGLARGFGSLLTSDGRYTCPACAAYGRDHVEERVSSMRMHLMKRHGPVVYN